MPFQQGQRGTQSRRAIRAAGLPFASALGPFLLSFLPRTSSSPDRASRPHWPICPGSKAPFSSWTIHTVTHGTCGHEVVMSLSREAKLVRISILGCRTEYRRPIGQNIASPSCSKPGLADEENFAAPSSAYLFSPLAIKIKGGWVLVVLLFCFVFVASDAMDKNLFISEKLCCGHTDCLAVVSIYENNFLHAIKRSFPFSLQTTLK